MQGINSSLRGKIQALWFQVLTLKQLWMHIKKCRKRGRSVKEALKVEKLQEWIPPPINWIKVNADAAVHKDQQVAGFWGCHKEFSRPSDSCSSERHKNPGGSIFCRSSSCQIGNGCGKIGKLCKCND